MIPILLFGPSSPRVTKPPPAPPTAVPKPASVLSPKSPGVIAIVNPPNMMSGAIAIPKSLVIGVP